MKIRQQCRITDRPLLPHFQTTVIFPNGLIRLVLDVGELLFLSQSKGRFHFFREIALIVFERQSIVAFLLNDLLGNLGLRAQSVYGHYTAC
jgi:hypothetical protein